MKPELIALLDRIARAWATREREAWMRAQAELWAFCWGRPSDEMPAVPLDDDNMPIENVVPVDLGSKPDRHAAIQISPQGFALVDVIHSDLYARLEAIAGYVCREFNVTLESLTGPLRDRRNVEARQACVLLASGKTAATLQEMASWLGRTNHTTTLHARRVAMNRFQRDRDFRRAIERIGMELDAVQLPEPTLHTG